MAITSFYIDGFNLYHAISALRKPYLKWVGLRELAESFVPAGDCVHSVTYFTANMYWNADKSRRHSQFIEAQKATGVEVVQSHFAKAPKFCHRASAYCNNYEEKQTDVALALRAMTDIYAHQINQIALITADSDYVPLFKHVRAVSPHTRIMVIAPPGRKKLARQLFGLADERREISEGRLGGCLLARNVVDSRGKVVARCPAAYCR